MNGPDLDCYLVCNEWVNWIRTLGADGAQGENTGFKGARQEGKPQGGGEARRARKRGRANLGKEAMLGGMAVRGSGEWVWFAVFS